MRVVISIILLAALVGLAVYYRDSVADRIAKKQQVDVTAQTSRPNDTPTPVPTVTATPAPTASPTPVATLTPRPAATAAPSQSIADIRTGEPLPTTGPADALIPLALAGVGAAGWGYRSYKASKKHDRARRAIHIQ